MTTPDAPLMLSISGLRGLIGSSLTPLVATRYAAAIGGWLRAQHAAGVPHVTVARDSRPSGAMIEAAVTAGLLGVGCKVTRLGILTTPGAAIMTTHLQAQAGVVITASHNPIIWNGIKTLRHDGVAPPPAEAQQIIDRFRADESAWVKVDALAPVQQDDTGLDVHLRLTLDQVDVPAIQRRKLKVVLDSVHGAGGPEGKALLDALGVELIHLWGEPTGQFPHTPEPLRENLTALAEAVREHGADIGFAQDPDADRLAVVDERGQYIGEEYTLALAALHVLSHRPPACRTLVANLSTSRMIDDIAAAHGGQVLRSKVGEANVAALMQEHGALLGGEGNGGVIWAPTSYVRDSLIGMALLLEMLAVRCQTLSQAVSAIPAYAIVKQKVDIKPGMAGKIDAALSAAFKQQRLDRQDGVRVDWPDRWVHVRPSNTEPILRLIAEAPTEADAQALVQQAAAAMGL